MERSLALAKRFPVQRQTFCIWKVFIKEAGAVATFLVASIEEMTPLSAASHGNVIAIGRPLVAILQKVKGRGNAIIVKVC